VQRTSKALILSHDHSRGGVCVLDKDGSFRFVRGYSSRPVGAEIDIEVSKVSFVNFRRVVAAAASFALILSLSCFAWLWNPVSFYVYMDVNPSVELQLNRLNRLRTAVPLNEGGAALLSSLRTGGNMETIAVSLIEAAERKGYLNTGDGAPALFISIIPAGGGSPDAAISVVNAVLEERGILDYSVVKTGDMDLRDRALELGVSPGRLMLAETLISASGGQMTLEGVLNMSAGEKFSAIQEANNPDNSDTPALPVNENDINTSTPPYSGNSPGSANLKINVPGSAAIVSAPPANNPSANTPPTNAPPPPTNTPPANVTQGNAERDNGRSDDSSSSGSNRPFNPPGGNDPPVEPGPDPDPTVYAEVVKVGGDEGHLYVRITVTYIHGTYTEMFGLEHVVAYGKYVVTTTRGRFTVYINFRGNLEVYTAEIIDYECTTCCYDPGEGPGSTVTAAVVRSGHRRHVTITVTYEFGTYTETFRFEPSLEYETYIVMTTRGRFMVYITFHGNEVQTAEILSYEYLPTYCYIVSDDGPGFAGETHDDYGEADEIAPLYFLDSPKDVTYPYDIVH